MTTTTKTASKFACTTPTPQVAITLPCPSCGECDAPFGIELGGLDDEAFECGACETTFTFDFLRRLVNAWAKVLPRVAALAEALAGDLDGIDDAGAAE